MKVPLIVVLILLFFPTIQFCHAADPTRNYEFLPIWQRSALSLVPMDVNAQTPGEELIVVYPNQVDVLTSTSLTHQKSFIVPADKPYSITPLPGESPDSLRLLFGYETPTASVFNLYLYDGRDVVLAKEKCLFFSGQDRDLDGRFHQTIVPVGLINGRNNKRNVLLLVDSGGDAGARGLLAIDPSTGKEVWRYLAGPQIRHQMIVDLENDGLEEIVLGSYAPKNELKLNGTSDDSCYVFVLDNLGNERWRKTIGPFWTGAFPIVGDLNGDGKKELVVHRFGTNQYFADYDELIQLDIRTGEPIHRQKLGSHFLAASTAVLTGICHDFDLDGIDEFVIGSTDGFVRMYRGDLSVMCSSEPYRRPIAVHSVADMDGDGLLEVIALTADRKIVFFNHQLKQLLIAPFLTNLEDFYLVKLPHKRRLLSSNGLAGTTTDYQLFDFHVVGLAGAIKKRGQNYLVIILSLAGLTVALVALRNHLYGKRAWQLLFQILEQTHSLDRTLILDRHQRISHWGKDWASLPQIPPHLAKGKKLQQVFGNSHVRPVGEALEKMLTEELTNYQCLCPIDTTSHVPLQFKALYISWIKACCVMIFDLREEEHIRQLKHWAQVAQRLAHGIKNPLTTIKLNAEELLHKVRSTDQIQAQDVEEYVTPIITQIDKLKKMSDGFMRFVEFEQPDLKPCDLNRECRELIPQWQPEKSGKIQIDWELEQDLPPAMIDLRQFEYAVKNVFYNALESIRDEGRILIATRSVQLFTQNANGGGMSSFVELEIRDTGCGIPPEYLDRVKQPYFSLNKPEGTGLGLSIVQKIMDSHGGQFDIQSEVGLGTWVILRFKQASTS